MMRTFFVFVLVSLFTITTNAQSTSSSSRKAERSFRWVLVLENPKEVDAKMKQIRFPEVLELSQNGKVIQNLKVGNGHVIKFLLTSEQIAAGNIDLIGSCSKCCGHRNYYTFQKNAVPLTHRNSKVAIRLVWGNNI